MPELHALFQDLFFTPGSADFEDFIGETQQILSYFITFFEFGRLRVVSGQCQRANGFTGISRDSRDHFVDVEFHRANLFFNPFQCPADLRVAFRDGVHQSAADECRTEDCLAVFVCRIAPA